MTEDADTKAQSYAERIHAELREFTEMPITVAMMEPRGVCLGVLVYLNCDARTAKYKSSKVCTFLCEITTRPIVTEAVRSNWCTRLFGFKGTSIVASKKATARVYVHVKVIHETISDLHQHPAALHGTVENHAVPHIKAAAKEAFERHAPSLNFDPGTLQCHLSTDTAYATESYSLKPKA